MKSDELKPGKILRGPLFPEQVQVLIATTMGGVVKFIGKGVNSSKVYDLVLTPEKLTLLETTPDEDPFDGDPHSFRLGIEAMRLALSFKYDPYFALSIARVDPLPHQLEAVYDYFLKLPRIRFLLADDPGAGKTIMAGLLLKELKIRGLVKRTLIITPASLSFQWQREMRDKFRENFEVIRSDVLRANLRDTISRGVANGILAYAGKTAKGDYKPFYFNQALLTSEVEFSEEMFLVTKETAEAYLKTKSSPPPPQPPTVEVVDPGKKTEPPPRNPERKPEQLTFSKLAWCGEVPHQKWMQLYTKVLAKFAGAKGMKLKVSVELTPDNGVSKQKLDETKAALRDLGLTDDVKSE